MYKSLGLLLLFFTLSGTISVAASSPTTQLEAEGISGSFEPAECWFESPIPILMSSDFECGLVTVPEFHSEPKGRTIRVPVHMSDRIRKLHQVSRQLEQVWGRKPTPEELAVEMDLEPSKVRWMLK